MKSCLTLCTLVDCKSFLSFTFSWSLLKIMSIELVLLSNHLILCLLLLLPPSIFPSNRIFFTEVALHIKWLKYWSFSFNISPSSEYSGLISLRIDWFDWLVLIHELLGRKNLCCPTHPLALPPRRKSNKNTGRSWVFKTFCSYLVLLRYPSMWSESFPCWIGHRLVWVWLEASGASQVRWWIAGEPASLGDKL